MISLELLIKKLHNPDLKIINPSSQTYLMAVRNETAAELYNDQIIHIMTVKEFSAAKNPALSGALFLFGTPSEVPETAHYSAIANHPDVVFFQSSSMNDVLSELQEIFSEHRRFTEYKLKLEALAQNQISLKDFFTLFSSYYNNPVAFGDSGGNLIYIGNLREDFKEYDETLNYWISHGYIPYEFSKDNGNIEMTSLWQKSPTPVLLNTGFAERYSRLSYRTCKNNRVYNNYFSIVEVHEKYRCFDEDVLILTGDLVSDYYTSHSFPEIELPRSKFFRKVVSLTDAPDTLLTERARQFHLLSSTPKCLVILSFSKNKEELKATDIKTTNQWNHVKSSLSHMQPPILSFEENQRMVLLLEAASEDGLNNLVKKLRRKLHSDITMACSLQFENIFEAHDMYQKALLAIDTGNALYPDSNLYRFEDLYFEALLYALHKNNLLSCFIIKGIEEMIEYDQKRNTEFAGTLYEYLLCDKNIADLSKNLHIHRNTALYRLEKANEWLHLDLNDYGSTTRLFLSFLALDFMKMVGMQKEPRTS